MRNAGKSKLYIGPPEQQFVVGQRVVMGKDRFGTVTEIYPSRCFPAAVKFDDSDYDVMPIYSQIRPI